MARHIKILEFMGHRRLNPRRCVPPSPIDVDLDMLKNALPDFPALVELRLTHVALTAAPIATRNTPPHPIQSLVVHTSRSPYYSDADRHGGTSDMSGGYVPSYGLPMFSTLSAVLSVVVPETLTLKGGYNKGPWDPVESFPAPTLLKIRRLDTVEHWLDSSYLHKVLAPGVLEHFTVKWPWDNRRRAVRLHALMEQSGSAMQSLQFYMDSGNRFMNRNRTEDCRMLGRMVGACTRLQHLTLCMPAYAHLLRPGEQVDCPPRTFYNTVLSAAPRSLRKLSFFLKIHCVHHGSERKARWRDPSEWSEMVLDIVGLEVLNSPWVRERFAQLERVEITIPTGVEYDVDQVLEQTLLHALPNLQNAGLLKIVKVPLEIDGMELE